MQVQCIWDNKDADFPLQEKAFRFGNNALSKQIFK